jgi:Fur family ferric uptake transcriptional regulator
VSGPAVEAWADRVGGEHGFTEVSHTVELSGVCGVCSRTGEAPKRTYGSLPEVADD